MRPQAKQEVGVVLGVALAAAGLLLAWAYTKTALQPIRTDVIRAQVRQIGGDETTAGAAIHAVRRDVHDQAVALAVLSGVIGVGAGIVMGRRIRGLERPWRIATIGLLCAIPMSLTLFFVLELGYDAAFRGDSF